MKRQMGATRGALRGTRLTQRHRQRRSARRRGRRTPIKSPKLKTNRAFHLARNIQLRALATLQERERVARELHDGPGQVLGYVKMQAKAARGLLAQDQKKEL